MSPAADARSVGAAGRPIVVHELAHACAALKAATELDVPVTLRSAAGAADYLGAGAFKAMIDTAGERWPDASFVAVLDCADAPGLALGAFRIGIDVVRFGGKPAVRKKLAEIAVQQGARLDQDRRKALDLLDCRDPLSECRAWLAKRAHDSRRTTAKCRPG